MKREMKKCPGSGTEQMLAWMDDKKSTPEFPNGYPGAVVCNHCSGGILVVRGSQHNATSQTGVDGRAGKIRVHYTDGDVISMRNR